jgi:hypothetical protein
MHMYCIVHCLFQVRKKALGPTLKPQRLVVQDSDSASSGPDPDNDPDSTSTQSDTVKYSDSPASDQEHVNGESAFPLIEEEEE